MAHLQGSWQPAAGGEPEVFEKLSAGRRSWAGVCAAVTTTNSSS